MRALVLMPIVGILAACSGQGSAVPAHDQSVVVFATSGGAFLMAEKTAQIDPYMRENPGVHVITDDTVNLPEIVQQVENHAVVWDLADISPNQAMGFCGTLFEPYDFSQMDLSGIDPRLISDCGVPLTSFSVVLAYDNTAFTGETVPKSWADFFDTKRFPGIRALPSDPDGGAMEIALLADGVAPDDLYPLDYARAFRKLDTLGDDLAFWATGSQAQLLMSSHEVAMIATWNGRGYFSANQGATYTPVWAQNLERYASISIPIGAPNPTGALKLANSLISAPSQGRFASTIPYGSVNANSTMTNTDPLFQSWLNTNFLDQSVLVDERWWAKNMKEATKEWIGWFAG